jgi:hypothetical protein
LGGGISEPAQRFADRLQQWFDETEFTTSKAVEKETMSKSSVKNWIAELRGAGVIERTSAPHGNQAARYRITPEDLRPPETRVLPAPSDIFGQTP